MTLWESDNLTARHRGVHKLRWANALAVKGDDNSLRRFGCALHKWYCISRHGIACARHSFRSSQSKAASVHRRQARSTFKEIHKEAPNQKRYGCFSNIFLYSNRMIHEITWTASCRHCSNDDSCPRWYSILLERPCLIARPWWDLRRACHRQYQRRGNESGTMGTLAMTSSPFGNYYSPIKSRRESALDSKKLW